ncbi:lysis system i-spanin subunit Rz [Providencia rettgeri]
MNKSGLSTYLVIGLALLVIVGKWHYDKKIAVQTAMHETTITAIALEAKMRSDAVIERMKSAQRTAAELDAEYSGKLKHELNENERLRRSLADGDKRLRFAKADLATCELSASRNTGSAGVGNGTEIRFSAEAGQLIYDIRAGIISDQAKLDYWQARAIRLEKQCRLIP